MPATHQQLAVVTGASSGIGFELARICGRNGFRLLIAANEPEIEVAADRLRAADIVVQALQADLSTIEGNDALLAATGDAPIGALLANAGTGLGHAFIDQPWDRVRATVDLNVMGTTYLLHRVLPGMKARGAGKVLVTGSIAGFMPGTYQAVYNATKAYLDSFTIAVRHELRGSGVSLTCLMPGATDTKFFERADMLDTNVGQAPKDDPAKVAQDGFDAMMRGESHIISGVHNKLLVAAARVTPAPILAEAHRLLSQPKR